MAHKVYYFCYPRFEDWFSDVIGIVTEEGKYRYDVMSFAKSLNYQDEDDIEYTVDMCCEHIEKITCEVHHRTVEIDVCSYDDIVQLIRRSRLSESLKYEFMSWLITISLRLAEYKFTDK